jgi:hypothetical protein
MGAEVVELERSEWTAIEGMVAIQLAMELRAAVLVMMVTVTIVTVMEKQQGWW